MPDGGYSVVSILFCLLFSRGISFCQFSNVIKSILLSFLLIAGLSVGAQAATVITEDFEGTVTGWNNSSIYNGGTSYTKIHGLHTGGYIGQSATQQVYKTFTIPDNTTEVQIEFDFLEVGFWFSKKFKLYVNDQQSAVGTFNYSSGDSSSSSTSLGSGTMGSYQVSKHRFNVTVPILSGETTLKVGFGSDGHEDTSWGAFAYWAVDNLKLTAETSEATGSLTVEKSVSGAGNTFAYTTTGTGLSDFTLSPTTDGTASQTFSDLTAGSYTITETALSGYDFASLSCTGDADNGNSIDVTNRTVTIDLDAGETQTCAFASSEQAHATGSLTVQKSVSGAGNTFAYTTTGTGLSNFTLSPTTDGTANQTFSGLTAGSYTITETALSGYDFVSLSCTGDTDNGNSINIANRTVTIDLDAGETQTCTFASTEQTGDGSGGSEGSPGSVAGEPVGTMPAKIGVTPGGAASYTIPIAVGQGTANLQPTISLDYNSDADRDIMGVGWKVTGLSYIGRCPTDLYHDDPVKGGIGIDPVDYDDNDKFCLNGERLVAIKGVYGADGTEYRTHMEEFSKVISHGTSEEGPSSFTVYKKSGEILTYGGTDNARFRVQKISLWPLQRKDFIRSWGLSKLSDAKGNFINYLYHNDRENREFNISEIQYTGNSNLGLQPYNSVRFLYETRPDIIRRFRSGDAFSITKRLVKIQTFTEDNLAREYRISYDTGDTGRSRIKSITECASSSTCFKPTTFFSMPEPSSGIDLVRAQGQFLDLYKPQVVGDFNGDGLTDFIDVKTDEFGRVHSDPVSKIKMSKGDGTFLVSYPTFYSTALKRYVSTTLPAGYKPAVTGDFNGDGLTDFLLYKSDTNGRAAGESIIWFSNGDGSFNILKPTVYNSIFKRYDTAYIQDKHTPVVTGDFNGDGLTDFVSAEVDLYGRVNSTGIIVWLSENDGRFKRKTYQGGLPLKHMPFVVGDLNGDGLTDFLSASSDLSGRFNGVSSGSSNYVWLSKGNGEFISRQLQTSIPDGYRPVVIGDFNGDGLIDFRGSRVDEYGRAENINNLSDKVWLSRGNGEFKVKDTSAKLPNFYKPHIIGDFNGDGFTDFLAASTTNHGLTWRLNDGDKNTIYFSNGDGTFREQYVAGIRSYYTAQVTGDFDGDGLIDALVYRADGNKRFYQLSNAFDYIWRSKHIANPDFLVEIVNGHGLKNNLNYKPLSDKSVYTKGSSAQYPSQDVVLPRYVVSELSGDNANGGTNVQTFKYEGLQYHLKGLRTIGFHKKIVLDERIGIKTEDTYSQDFASERHGLLKRNRIIAPNNNLLSDKEITWGVRSFDAGTRSERHFRYQDTSTTTKYDLNGTFISREIEKTTFDDLGFRTRIEMTMENEDGSEKFNKVADNTFTHNLDTWRLGQLIQTVVTQSKAPYANASDTVVNTTAFTYDTDGYLLSTTKEPGDALSHTTTNTLNAYGVIKAVTETWSSNNTDGVAATSRITSFEFDPKVRFITKETNPLGHTESKTYHPILGVASSVTGPNGLTTTFEHDAFGRVTKETKADGTYGTSDMQFCVVVTCPAGAVYRIRNWKSDGSESHIFLNKLNLEIHSASLLNGQWTKVLTEYDEISREKRKTQPHFYGETQHWTVNTYDILDRKTRVDRPDGSFQTATFNGLTQVSTNELGQTKTITKNVIQKDAAITNHESQTITYTYDGAGQLLTMTANGEVTSYTYDIRGNKISDSDPDKGTWTYRYNALGKIVAQTNSKGEITRMSYDVLDRMLTRTDNSDQAGSQDRITRWYYDTAANGIGKLYRTTRSNGYELINSYDTLGRPITTQETIDGENFTTSTTYDSQSRPDTTAYPSGVVTKNTYDAQGTLLKVANNDGSETWWERLEADARGNVTKARHGNGVETMRTFDPTTGRLTSIYSYKGAEVIQDLTYTKDYLGNLTRREDKRLNQVETFVYDNLNRVTQVDTTVAGSSNTVTMTYGITGNILTKSDVGAYTYGQVHASCGTSFAGPHAVTTVSGTKNATYCYDANGNMTSGDGRITTYTVFDKPTQITKGGNTVNFYYGPDRKRFKRIDNTVADGTKTTIYAAGKAYERITDTNGVQEKHYVGDFAVITKNTANGGTLRTSYMHRDHLGSVDVLTDETGTVQQRMSFDTWGKRREINWQQMTEVAITTFDTSITTRGFTGHEQIDQVGLVHMNGRVYEPELGRFLSADPVIEAIDNLQTYNRYSYVRNNPVTHTDPSGFTVKDEGDGATENIESEDAKTVQWFSVQLVKIDDLENKSSNDFTTNIRSNPSQVPGKKLSLPKAGEKIWGGGLNVIFDSQLQRSDMSTQGMTRVACGWGGCIGLGLAAYGVYELVKDGLQDYNDVQEGKKTYSDVAVERIPEAGLTLVGGQAGRWIMKGGKKVWKAFKKNPCNSFAAGTLVATPDGMTMIERLKVGDEVLSRDEKTGKEGHKKVTQLFKDKHANALIVSFMKEGADKADKVIITHGHHVYLKGKGWVKAQDLKVGSVLMQAGGSPLVVTNIELSPKAFYAYNIEVSDYHTYFVGNHRAWVHNCTKMDPNDIELSHPAALSKTFGNPNHGTVADLVEKLKADPSLADKIDPIEIYKHKGKWYSANNRRLRAFQEAGVEVRTVPASKKEIRNILKRINGKK